MQPANFSSLSLSTKHAAARSRPVPAVRTRMPLAFSHVQLNLLLIELKVVKFMAKYSRRSVTRCNLCSVVFSLRLWR